MTRSSPFIFASEQAPGVSPPPPVALHASPLAPVSVSEAAGLLDDVQIRSPARSVPPYPPLRGTRGPRRLLQQMAEQLPHNEAFVRPAVPPSTPVHMPEPEHERSDGQTRRQRSKDPSKPITRPKRANTTRRREQCRANQARYRERQKQRLATEEEETACLRELVGLLQDQRSFLRISCDPSFEYARHVVTSFFRRFRRGLSRAGSDATITEFTEKPPQWINVGRAGRNFALLRQIAFVRCVVSEDADFGGSMRGPDALLEQCWRYSALHTNLRVELLSIHRSTPFNTKTEHVVATAEVVVDMDEQTLSRVFPGLRSDLQSKLLGEKVAYIAQFDLEFAKAGSSRLLQLVWATSRIDLAEILSRILHNGYEVEEVLRCARISMHGCISDSTPTNGTASREEA